MKERFNLKLNRDYNFDDDLNIKEIEAVEAYSLDKDSDVYAAGLDVLSPWGKNKVVEVWQENGQEFCKKRIEINPFSMLSLQKHRGRKEQWSVLEGVLSVIVNGDITHLQKGEDILIPLGASHCMINMSGSAVKVEEIQIGICREKDNIRLKDFLGRPTYPLSDEIEKKSYDLYLEIMEELKGKNSATQKI